MITQDILFPRLAELVRGMYEQNPDARRHGSFEEHDFVVGSFASIIAPDPKTGLLGVAAGYCHSIDHLVGGSLDNFDVESPANLRKVAATPEELECCLRQLLADSRELSEENQEEVAQAVLNHEGTNEQIDLLPHHLVAQTLVEADRLANMTATILMRGARFSSHLPLVDLVNFENDLEANYRNPKSVLWDVANCASWGDREGPYALRLPKARELGAKYAARLRQIIAWIREDYADAGLVSHPKL
ncbi:MAG: hypothetical protein AAB738_03115 [Patescibacteria group bacterium]